MAEKHGHMTIPVVMRSIEKLQNKTLDTETSSIVRRSLRHEGLPHVVGVIVEATGRLVGGGEGLWKLSQRPPPPAPLAKTEV